VSLESQEMAIFLGHDEAAGKKGEAEASGQKKKK